MRIRCEFTPQAISDLEDIWNFIAKDSYQAANRVETAILSSCNRLARNPKMGAKREEITPLPVRFWTVTRFPNYIIVYLPDTEPLKVITVLQGRRDIKHILEKLSGSA